MQFEFATAARIIFGAGTAEQLPGLASAMGRRVLLVTGAKPDRHIQRIDALAKAGLACTVLSVAGEPSLDDIEAARAEARKSRCDMVIAIGGGSVIDSGKALAALIPNPGAALDYLEVIGAGEKLTASPMPFIALPTTAGTGAEVTKNAVLSSSEHGVKVSLRDERMLPDIAVVDPLLTHSLPPAATASTGMDALTQLLEPFVSHLANPLTDALCEAGLRRAGRSLRRVLAEPDAADARADMALASLLGGLALANVKLGAVHGFAGVLGGLTGAPHGTVCAALLPGVMQANLKALTERAADSPALEKYHRAAQLLLDSPAASAQDALDWLKETSRLFAIPRLGELGVDKTGFAEIVAKSQASSSMKGNPILLDARELTGILAAAL
ncbi:MAG: iron-containing alcohol dehydrogenase [Chloroflexi bacterium]|nr:iron-containing alcohol dehydrogenase [Chloroflexota bacterium]MCY3717154.1 iron-containing alcohol dehydrogenase [Chloroflexota bacterium]MDE2651723.1 iron-containing alcohol dehydrogenase [Chloroflexota bacterium]MXX51001.1 iron-containing alcohol dehydrogenase [Chloroflexota bacterium]MXX83430.1 iron-containing alcohol dehydrogenase [Chloroflexota bacterium]